MSGCEVVPFEQQGVLPNGGRRAARWLRAACGQAWRNNGCIRIITRHYSVWQGEAGDPDCVDEAASGRGFALALGLHFGTMPTHIVSWAMVLNSSCLPEMHPGVSEAVQLGQATRSRNLRPWSLLLVWDSWLMASGCARPVGWLASSLSSKLLPEPTSCLRDKAAVERRAARDFWVGSLAAAASAFRPRSGPPSGSPRREPSRLSASRSGAPYDCPSQPAGSHGAARWAAASSSSI